jgi:hypothetical protein
MALEPTRQETRQDWAQIRYDYEHTDRAVEDICAEHGMSSGTLRDRMRRWGWTRRRTPIPREGPPPVLPIPRAPTSQTSAAHSLADEPDIEPAAPCAAIAVQRIAPGEDAGAPDAGNPGEIVPRLQSAVARVLPAIEATVVRLTAEPMPPREMEQAARALSSLTRTLRELNGLLGRHQAPAADDDPVPDDIDEFRAELARRIEAFIAEETGEADGEAEPQGV